MDPSIFARIALLSAVLAMMAPNGALPNGALPNGALPNGTLPNRPSVNVTTSTPAAGYIIYVVQSGDTLYSIALNFNTTPATLQQVNHLADTSTLTPGQKIQVPVQTATATPTAVPPPLTYTVRTGDTLAKIAASFGVTVSDLARTNGIKDVNAIDVGQVLSIPGKVNPLPESIALMPALVKQGNTLEFKITVPDVVTATGTFAGANLHFISANGAQFALAGISRCANTTSYAASITVQNAAGQVTPYTFNVRVNPTDYPVQDITLTPGMAALLDPAIERAENARVANLVAPVTLAPLWNGPFLSPLKIQDPPISALFGTRRSYNGGPVGACGHEGQDFAVDGGTPVYAPAGGVVVLAEPLKVRGNVVFVNHGLGVYSGFYHLSKIDAKAGQTVKPGDLLGKVGTTGFSTGDHLHWSLWVNGVYVDPIEWTTRTIP